MRASRRSKRTRPEMNEILTVSNELVDELLASDHIAISTPVYNYNIPANLKSYVDHIVRKGRTLGIKGEGLVHGKKCTVLMASVTMGGVAAQALLQQGRLLLTRMFAQPVERVLFCSPPFGLATVLSRTRLRKVPLMKLICFEEHAIDSEIEEATKHIQASQDPYLTDVDSQFQDVADEAHDELPHLVTMKEAKAGFQLGAERVAQMDRYGIDVQVLSYSSAIQLAPARNRRRSCPERKRPTCRSRRSVPDALSGLRHFAVARHGRGRVGTGTRGP